MSAAIPDLSLLHPLLKLPLSKVLWFNEVQKLDTRKHKQKRLFAITNFGLFLIKKTKFPRSMTVSKFFALSDIRYFLLDPEMAIISDNPKMSSKITVYTEKVVELASVIFSVNNVIFGEHSKLNFQCTTEIKPKFDASNFLYEAQCPLAERFLSFVASEFPAKQINAEIIQEHIDILMKATSSFTFTGDLAASSFIRAMANAIANDSELREVKLSDLNYSSFFPHFLPIIQENTSVYTLLLSNVNFSGKPLKRFPKEHKFIIQSVKINKCKISTPDFAYFMDHLSFLSSELNDFTVTNSIFSDEAIEKFFQTLSTIDRLDTLKFEEIKVKKHEVFERVLSNFLAKVKKLRRISLAYCKQELSGVLSKITKVNSIARVNVSGNTFLDKIDSHSLNFEKVDEIYFDKCEFNENPFISILKALQNSSTAVTILHFDCIPNDSQFVYDILENVTIPTLETLTWNENSLDENQTESFKKFIQNNQQITELELINCSLSPRKLMDIFHGDISDNISRLILKNTTPQPKFTFGRSLVKILTPLSCLKILDITNQKLGNDAIMMLRMFVESHIEEIYFDGQEVESAELLLSFLAFLNNSESLLKSSWPEYDVSLIVSKTPIGKRLDVRNSFDRMKKDFSVTFNTRQSLVRQNSRMKFATPTSNVKRKVNKSSAPIPIAPSTGNEMYKKVDEVLGFRESSIDDLLKECLGKDNYTDVLVSKYYSINGL
ncbi:hypothetical protein TRFO_29905 [Tritrichomonas foetus]|uniref:Leucine Rich Repeat family protein n=1 Tax=Tritrichomonas foetus TaxID=1144522 RepID=A0A1J4JZ78_9EUKA|nr:hypothetical protein TRFO_29905 [Tritrichomonas foetus]|eukprot:OHT02836.1 hypothetical protein TRFO_29905 [Tritrichomonas foetus]